MCLSFNGLWCILYNLRILYCNYNYRKYYYLFLYLMCNWNNRMYLLFNINICYSFLLCCRIFLKCCINRVATCSSCLTTGASSTVGNNCADSSYFYPIVTDSLGTLNTGTTFTNCNSTYSSSGAGVLTCNYLTGALTCAEGYFL